MLTKFLALPAPVVPVSHRIAPPYPNEFPSDTLCSDTVVESQRVGEHMVVVVHDWDCPHFDINEPVALFSKTYGGGIDIWSDHSSVSHKTEAVYSLAGGMYASDLSDLVAPEDEDEDDYHHDYEFEDANELLIWRLNTVVEEYSPGQYMLWYRDEFEKHGGKSSQPSAEYYRATHEAEVYGFVVLKCSDIFEWDPESGEWVLRKYVTYADGVDSCWGFVGEPDYCLQEGMSCV